MPTTYSEFFSSGLLAQSHTHNKTHSPPSPAFLSSPDVTQAPFSMDQDSDVENLDITLDVNSARTSIPTTDNGRSRSECVGSTRQHAQRPRLRKRRSSLTVSTSPMNMIKSPQRNASNALLLQQRLPQTGSLDCSCSGNLGSFGLDQLSTTAGRSDDSSFASQSLARMRSGSVGSSILPRTRRIARRLTSVPKALAPPTIPLPALPDEASKHAKPNHSTSIFSSPKMMLSKPQSRPPLVRGSSLIDESVVFKPKGQDDTPINEVMKEN